MDKVSIIIPTYNRAACISKGIESALAQDYPNIEVIVSDDASTDHTAEVAKKYLHDKRFRYIKNEKNLGMAPNWRKSVLEYSTGDWALILGDDDYFVDSSFLSKAMAVAAKDKEIVMVHANCRVLFEKEGYHKDTDKRLPEITDGKWMFLNYVFAVKGTVNYDILTVLFKKEIAREVDIFLEPILTVDRLSFLKISLHGKVGFVNDVAAVYRLHGGNLINTLDLNNFFDNLKSITVPYEYAKKLKAFGPEELEKWKRRLIRDYAETILIYRLRQCGSYSEKINCFTSFSGRLFKEYPFSITIMSKLLNPKTLARVLGFRRPRLFSS